MTRGGKSLLALPTRMPHNEILAVGFDLGHPMCVVLAHYFTDLKLRCATLTLRNRQADHSGGNQAACCSE